MDLVRQSLAITLVFLLLWLLLWLLRRKGLASFGGRMRLREQHRDLEVLERVALTPQHSLQMVRIQDRKVIVAVHPGGVTLLVEPEQGSK